MKKYIRFSSLYHSSSSELHLSIDRLGSPEADVEVCMDDVCVLLDDILSDWYCLSKEQQDKLREFFHDPITFEE